MMDELQKLWELIDTNNINIRARYILYSHNRLRHKRLRLVGCAFGLFLPPFPKA
jgi:Ribonuclease G/E